MLMFEVVVGAGVVPECIILEDVSNILSLSCIQIVWTKYVKHLSI